MKSDIIELLIKSNFSATFINYIKNEFPIHYTPLFKQPYHQENKDNPLINLSPTERLFASLAELTSLHNYYFKKNIPQHYLYKNITDLNYRIERYHKKYRIYGLSKRDIKWLVPLFRAEIFDLGSLRFQRYWFSVKEIEREGYDYMALNHHWRKKFPEGTPMIEIHIGANTDFRENKIDEAFNLAHQFFETYFNEHLYDFFICRTWLIYPKTKKILNKKSNILSFAKRFEIIASNNNAKQALDRIYENNNLEEIEKMDKITSLQKIAYKNLDKLGVAAGIIPKAKIKNYPKQSVKGI